MPLPRRAAAPHEDRAAAPRPAPLPPAAARRRPLPDAVAARARAAPPAPKPAACTKPAAREARRSARSRERARAAAAPQIAVSVEKTQWHPLADRRIAWLRVPGDPDALRVVEGDVVDGLLVAVIEPSGVVFERDGEKIRRPLGR